MISMKIDVDWPNYKVTVLAPIGSKEFDGLRSALAGIGLHLEMPHDPGCKLLAGGEYCTCAMERQAKEGKR